MNKKYIFTSEAEAETMILALAQQDEDGNLPNFREVRNTPTTYGVVVLGFQDKVEFDEETEEMVVIEEGTTFNVDVAWKTVDTSWDAYEVFPTSSNHNFL
jgi:hypothetical protein